ncbi:hypothetical protein PSHT_13094 [Puccinia striiformis]|uniref:RNA-directed DNA polymerase n=1 Tax=Puccinia striiformis TaxID=27350 RepID=A0A2S4USL9_9BASI|nr:hypothetical protein PSHT_13094 [Puccinia striiformis]
MPSAHRRNSFQSSFPVVNLASLDIPAYKGKTTVSPGHMRERKTSNESSEFNPAPLPGFNDNAHRDNQSVSSHQYQPPQPQPQYINPNPYNSGLTGAAPHFLEAKISLPVYDPTPFGRKPVKIKPESKDLLFNGTNMEISDFITRLEKAAQVDGALGSDIAIQYQKEFQDFNIQVDNLVAYLIRVQHMLSVEEIRHSKELRTITILENDENLEELKVVRPSQPQPQKFSTPDKSVDELTKTLSSWNTQKQKPTPFVSASHVPYKPAQLEKDLSHLKYELDKLIKKEGTSIFLPDGTQIPYDRTRPYKQIVDQYHASRTQPGIINLPPGTTIQKAEPVPEAQTSFGKLEEMEHQDHHCYDCEMAKRLRNKILTLLLTPLLLDQLLPLLLTLPPPLRKFQSKLLKIVLSPKEKAQKKTTVERPLSNQYPDAEDKLVKQMLANRMDVSVGELLAVSPSVTEKFKKSVSSKRVPLDQTKSTNAGGMDPHEDCEEGEEVGEINIHYSCPLGYVTLSVNGRSFQALLDNGSQVNLMSKNLANKMGLVITQRKMNLRGIGGHKSIILGVAETVPVKIGSVIQNSHFWVSADDIQPIIGTPFLMDAAAVLQFQEKGSTFSITKNGHTYLIPLPILQTRNGKLPSLDPYQTPLTPFPPEFTPTWKITEERLKVINFGPADFLWAEELKLFKHLIITRQDAFAFGPEERGLLKHTYGQPYVIPVIKHEPWQQKPIPIPTAIKDQFIELVRERIKTGLYEQSFSTYSSPVFCVKKQDGKLRVVHDLQKLNKVTIKDSGLPPNPEELIESFTGRACYGLGDIMGGYDERELAPESRPLTTFETPLGRFQLTRLPQGATNSVAVYQAQMMWILQDEIPHNVGIFIDDGGIKGPVSDYNQETLKENPGIRRFIWEYAITLERILFRIEEAGLTVSGKIRGFLGVCVYVRMFIPGLSELASPLRKLTRKDADWDWTDDCDLAFQKLKKIIGYDITLKKLDYSEDAGAIKLAVDSSFIAAGAVLSQEDKGLDRPVLYESVVFTPTESKYSQSKLELCGVAKILKKLQTQLWGQHFELLIDAKSLIEMINSPSLPNAPMTRWIAFINSFLSL